EGECELTAAAGALGVIVECPLVARAVVAERGGAKLAGDERRDERAAALVAARDEGAGNRAAAGSRVRAVARGAGGAPAPAGWSAGEEPEEPPPPSAVLGKAVGSAAPT